MKFGTLDGVREKITKFQSLLAALGNEGTFEVKPQGPQRTVRLDLSESVSVTLTVPFRMDYRFQSGVLTIQFREPYPVGQYRVFKKDVTFLEVTPERIDIGLDWAPDGYLEIVS